MKKLHMTLMAAGLLAAAGGANAQNWVAVPALTPDDSYLWDFYGDGTLLIDVAMTGNGITESNFAPDPDIGYQHVFRNDVDNDIQDATYSVTFSTGGTPVTFTGFGLEVFSVDGRVTGENEFWNTSLGAPDTTSSDIAHFSSGFAQGIGNAIPEIDTQVSGFAEWDTAASSGVDFTYRRIDIDDGAFIPSFNGSAALWVDADTIAVPEPSSALLVGISAIGILLRRRRRC